MPRKKLNTQPAAIDAPQETPPATSEKKWAEPYRPLVTNKEAGFEMGENKVTGQMIFYFTGDPGSAIKERLKHYGYFYRGDQKAWTVKATPTTQEIARRLAAEFAGGKQLTR